MKKTSSKKLDKNKFILFFSRGISIVLGLLMAVFLFFIFKTNIFPLKFLIMFVFFAIIICSLFIFFLWRKTENWIRIFVSCLGVLLSVLCFVGIVYIESTYKFIHNMLSGEYENITYNVVVLNNSYEYINALEGKSIGLIDTNYDKVVNKLGETISFVDSLEESTGDLYYHLFEGKTSAIVVDNDVYDMLKEFEGEYNFEEETKIIFTFEVSTEVTEEQAKSINVETDPFIVYISGIDQWGKVSTVRGRSDVNILAVVNPKTHKILLLNTPRDYYVKLHNKGSIPDKLTHAGIYGIDVSMKTLEDLYEADINYFLRVNFDTLVQLVDEIGGIDVNSDTAFYSSHKKGWYVEKGINHLDGKKALAYSRERYAYLTGDRHRGKNQQDVLSAIIKKTTSSKVLLTKYNKILNSLDDSFQTNIPTNMVTDFIKYQLDKMPNWDVQSISVSGSDSYDYTYSYGTKQKLYVMVPYQNDVLNAIQKINEVLDEK